jgi:hypothetical protein
VAHDHYKSDFIARIISSEYWDLKGISWSAITSGGPSFRLLEAEHIANNAALCIFPKTGGVESYLAYLNSSTFDYFVKINTQTLNYLVGDIMRVPYKELPGDDAIFLANLAKQAINIVKSDWNSFEQSLEFLTSPLLVNNSTKIAAAYITWTSLSQNWLSQLQAIEDENNTLHAKAYRLTNDITQKTSARKLALSTNPLYLYSASYEKLSEVNKRFQSDSIAELISYSIGFMMGRYSLDR